MGITGGVRRSLTLSALAGLVPAAMAGGGPENALLVVNPQSAESMYIANYYRQARDLPESNLLYMAAAAPSYTSWTGVQHPGFTGDLVQRRVGDHIDYVIVTPGNDFRIFAPGLISDGCFPVGYFSVGSVFAMAQIKNDVLGGMSSQSPNMYYPQAGTEARAFSSNVSWLGGVPSTHSAAKRYYIGAMLGSIEGAANTVPEILAMIDRSVAADGTRPPGTFYFMDNAGDPARNVRVPLYPPAVTALTGLGFTAQVPAGALPPPGSVCLGVMTGFSGADIVNSGIVMRPGSFGDHLTSYAGMLSGGGQTVMSDWIKAGASGTAGTVDEPCNYTGKFNNPRFHAFYAQGMSIGEAYLRSMAFVPFQNLLYGDPLTRAFARLPSVTPNFPAGSVLGTIQFTPQAATTQPGATIVQLDLFIDGVLHSSKLPGQAFSVNTLKLLDGWHDVRVVAYDSTLTRSAGRAVGSLIVDNAGRSGQLGVTPSTGNLTKVFTFDASASGGTIAEIRLLQNGRVVASRAGAGSMFVWGQSIGAGPSRLITETEFTDGSMVRSQPVTMDIAFENGTSNGLPPVAFAYTKRVLTGAPAVVELASTYDADPATVQYTIVTPPTKGTLSGTGGWRVLTPNPEACGEDSIVFHLATASGQSGDRTIRIIYQPGTTACRPDFNGDGLLNLADFGAFQTAFALGQCRADMNNDGVLNLSDFGAFTTAFAVGCQ
ncbi:MAG: hypothetical protein IT437_14110 [Phycisphaerales bacterium]|nr:hypothetical protein [Phycisphaerales bacterium]